MMKQQNGAAMVEFAIIALLFFALLFSVIETSRWMFNWNILNEATRRGARIAAVCPFEDPYINVATVFGDKTGTSSPPQDSPILDGLHTNDVAVTYYKVDSAGNRTAVAVDDPEIVLVEVAITYSHQFLAPVIGDIIGNIVAPTFRTILPIESLGALQTADANRCPSAPVTP